MTRSLLLKFSRNECTEEEIKEVQQWLADGSWPELPDSMEVSDEVRQRIWERIHNQVQPIKTSINRRTISSNIAKVAAIALILIGTALFILYKVKENLRPIVYTTGLQQHQKIVLPDSSVVFLSPHSSLTIMQPYGNKQRTIHLTGEAVFEVSHNASSPFMVITRDIATTALGTSFKVSSVEGKDINIALSYGKVVVEDTKTGEEGERIFLQPGEEVIYHNTTHTLQKTAITSQKFDYRNNILYFKDAGIKEVVDKLERYYQVEVDYTQIKDADWSVSGEFDYQPLDVVMKAIAYSCNIKFRIDGHQLVITPLDLPAENK